MEYVTIKGKKFKVKKANFNDFIEKKIFRAKTLNLNEQNIENISEIEGLESLTDLRQLFLSNNKITEIKGLENLENLENLWLHGNQITDIKGLENLTNLRYLSLYDNKISEIKGLESLSKLILLELYGNEITEIKGLKNLSNLKWLNLHQNKIKEIKGLENFVNLQALELYDNEISEIKGLENLTNLRDLSLSWNEITEINGLESLSKLFNLGLSGNQITEINGLESLSKLFSLGLSGNQITEIKGFEYLLDLKSLYLNINKITEINGLESLQKLEYLDLRTNQITEIKGLENLPFLKSLYIGENPIPYDIIEKLEGLLKDGKANNPQEFVKYCLKRIGVKRKKEEKITQIEVEKAQDTEFKQIPDKKSVLLAADISYPKKSIFISYSHKDKEWLDRLQVHLKPLEREGIISRWDDTLIKSGDEWLDKITQALNYAKVAILLVSADFLASDFITDNELPPLLEAAKTQGTTILPLIVSPCRFTKTKDLSRFQAINDPKKPLIKLNKGEQEEVFMKLTNVVEDTFRNNK